MYMIGFFGNNLFESWATLSVLLLLVFI